MKKLKSKPSTMLEIMKGIRSTAPRGRSTVMLTKKDKLQKRCNAKQQWKREVAEYVC